MPTLSSSVPRPQTQVPSTVPEKAGCVQFFSVPGSTGTTSWWDISRIGGSCGRRPFQV